MPLEMPYLHWCAPHRAPHAGRRNAEKGRFKTIYFVYDRAQIHVELSPVIIRCTQVQRKAPPEPRYGPGPPGVAILQHKVATATRVHAQRPFQVFVCAWCASCVHS